MANLAARFREEHPGAGVLRRSRNSIHLDTGNGQRVALFGRNLHYKQAEDWLEVETDWQDDDAEFPDVANRAQHSIGVRNDATWRFTPRQEVPGEFLEFGLMEYMAPNGRWRSLPAGVKNRDLDQLVFDGSSVRIEYISAPERMKFNAVLKDSSAPARVRWPFTVVGMTLGTDWILTSIAEGVPVAMLPLPTMADAAGTERAVGVTLAGGYLEYSADVTGLVYPIAIDPSPLTLQPDGTAGIDTRIDSSNATTNFSTNTQLWVGKTIGVHRSLILFDLSDLDGTETITATTLSLYCYQDYSDNARTFRVYRNKRVWVEAEATWNIWSTGNNWATAGAFGTDDCEQTDIGNRAFTATETLDEFKDFSLTASTKTDLDYGLENAGSATGWLIKADTENADLYIFRSSDHTTASERPKLVIEYTEAGGTTVTQSAYRWRNDDGSESAATWAANENTAHSVAAETPIRLRVQLDGSGDPDAAQYRLEYKKQGDAEWSVVE